MNRKISVGMAVSIVILAMTVTFSITMLVAMRLFDSTVSSVKEKESMYNKIAEVDQYVRSNDYYTIDDITLYDRLTAGYLLGTGDKYARYYNATAYTELVNVQNGTILGIGVELAIDQSGYAKVTKVYDGSPAHEAGITVGDYLTAVDGTDIKNLTGVEAVQTKLRGESGTTVNVTWLDSEATEHTADLTHSGYNTTTVDYEMLQDNVGYIRVRQFDGSTPSELDYAIRALSANGAASLVFDLRDNGGGVLDDNVSLPGAAAIGSGSVADGATEVKSDITIEGKVIINATSGGDVAIGDSNGETRFSGLQVGTTITRHNAKGDDVSQPGDVPEPEKPAQPTVTPTETEAAEASSTGSVEVERPVTVEWLYVTNVLGKQITHTCTQNGTTLTIRANGIVTSAHLTLGMVRTLKAQGVKTLVFTTLLSRSTTVSVDALLAAEPDAPDETAVVWTHTGPRAALTIDGADHSALLK